MIFHSQESGFALRQNAPNPFRNTSIIRYSLPEGYNDKVTISLYSAKGELIDILVREEHTGDDYSISVDTEKLVKGIYFYQIKAKGFEGARKMIVVD